MDFFGLRSFFLIVFVFASTLHGFHSQPIRTPFLNVRTGDSPVSLVEPRPAVVVTGRGGSTTAATWTYFRNSTQDNSYGFGSATARTRVIYPENRVPFPTDKRSTSPLISSWISWYMKALKQRPLLTKASTAAVVQVLGDAISQPLSAYSAGRVFVYDYPRTLCFALVGFFFKAPFLHSWYGITAGFGQRLQRLYRWNDGQRIAAELALDQSVGVLAFLPAYFYVYEFFSALVAGRAPSFLPFTLQGLGPIFAAILANYSFWPFSQFVSFRYVPESLRVLHTNLAAILWNIYFCSRVAQGH